MNILCSVYMLALGLIRDSLNYNTNKYKIIILEGAEGKKVMNGTAYYLSAVILILFSTCRTASSIKAATVLEKCLNGKYFGIL